MDFRRLFAIAPAGLAGAVLFGSAEAEISGGVIRVGVLNDQSSLYADLAGPGSVVAAEMAVEDFRAEEKGLKVEVLAADHENKADVATGVVRRWLDRDGVDLVLDVPNSSVALSLNELLRGTRAGMIVSAGATSDLTGRACSPNTVHWTYDTWALANVAGQAIVKGGGDTWFFITVDNAFGHSLETDTAAVIEKNGGAVIGRARHPINNADFSAFLLAARASGAKIVGLANAGSDTTNAIRQAAEFGIVRGGQRLAGLLVFLTDVHALGLRTVQGLTLASAFYWDLNDGTRAFTRRFAPRNRGIRPTMAHAGVYSGLAHYLKATATTRSDDARVVFPKMKELPVDDPLFGRGAVRADGRKIHQMHLFEVKPPAESTGTWDYYKLRATVPAEQAFRPIEQGGCRLAR
jgi:branched-chain amino acid transport system substrate-binding protein